MKTTHDNPLGLTQIESAMDRFYRSKWYWLVVAFLLAVNVAGVLVALGWW